MDRVQRRQRAFAVICSGVFALAVLYCLCGRVEAAQPSDDVDTASVTEVEAPAEDSGGPRLIDLQTAGVEELQRLPGIGVSRAEAIIRFREQRPLRRVRDLNRIYGIGPRLIRRITPLVTISPPGE